MAFSTSRADFLFEAVERSDGSGSEWVLGVDLGQSQDHTAFALVEKRVRKEVKTDGVVVTGVAVTSELVLRAATRVRLGMSYPEVARRVVEIVSRYRRRGRVTVVVDATGVGAAVLDLLKEQVRDGYVVGVVSTGGSGVTRSGGKWNVPRVDLVAGLRVLLERGRLKAAGNLRGRETLISELIGFGGHGEKQDDMVMAVALAGWWGGR